LSFWSSAGVSSILTGFDGLPAPSTATLSGSARSASARPKKAQARTRRAATVNPARALPANSSGEPKPPGSSPASAMIRRDCPHLPQGLIVPLGSVATAELVRHLGQVYSNMSDSLMPAFTALSRKREQRGG